MKVKTEDLTGPALDWAVAKCMGHIDARRVVVDFKYRSGLDPIRWEPILDTYYSSSYSPSTEWDMGGPIIEREEIYLAKSILGGWTGSIYIKAKDYNCIMHAAPTPLIAAMRCYVASKLGDEIEVPGELFSFA